MILILHQLKNLLDALKIIQKLISYSRLFLFCSLKKKVDVVGLIFEHKMSYKVVSLMTARLI